MVKRTIKIGTVLFMVEMSTSLSVVPLEIDIIGSFLVANKISKLIEWLLVLHVKMLCGVGKLPV